MKEKEQLRKELEMLKELIKAKLRYGSLHFEIKEIYDEYYLLGNDPANLLSGTELRDLANMIDSDNFIWWIGLNYTLKIKRPTIFISHRTQFEPNFE